MEPTPRTLTGSKPAGLLARLAVIVVATLMVVGGFAVGRTAWSTARLTDSAPVGGNTLTTAVSFDTAPPSISASVISKTTPYLPGYIRPSASFYVYANVTDPGTSPSGVASVTANVSSIKAGSTSVALVAGSYSIGGVSYNYRSAALTADAKPPGTYSYTITAVDNNSNSANASFSVVVDSTVPTGSDVQTANGGGTAGRAEINDTITFTFSETMDPESVLSGWTGASTSVVLRIAQDGTSNDTVTIRNAANTAELPLGSVDLNGDAVTADVDFGASGTPSTMVQSGATITVTLGTPNPSSKVRTDSKTTPMVWTPSATATDRAGNACSTAPATESGAADVNF